MPADRIHRARSTDGTEIAARVHGAGPPLVLYAGGPGDGEVSWDALVPHLRDRFTCYAMSTRNRGLSGTSDDTSLELIEADLRCLVESIGEPVTVLGWSSACPLVLEVAAKTDAVAAVVAYEPMFLALRPEAVQARNDDAVARIVAAVSEERLVDAAQVFFEDLGMAQPDELPRLAELGVFEATAPNIPVLFQDAMAGGVGAMSDHALLEEVSVPVMLLRGTETEPFYAEVVEHLASRLPEAEVRDLPGVAHFAPVLAPELVAPAVAAFAA